MQEAKGNSKYKMSLKDKILEVAMKNFALHGIRAVKMDDIASQLGISKRTLYEIYFNKEELLYEGVIKYESEKQKSFSDFAGQATNVMEILKEFYRRKTQELSIINPAFFADMRKYPKVVAYLENQHKNINDQQTKFFKRGISEGYFRREINYEILRFTLEAIGDSLADHEILKKYPVNEIFSNIFFVTLRGMCTQKGIAALESLE